MKKESAENKDLTKAGKSPDYDETLDGFIELLETSRRSAVRAVNSLMTATYWEIGRRIVEIEQGGKERADYYGDEIVDRLSVDLSARFGRGFKRRNLFQMRQFYLSYQNIVQTLSAQSQNIVQIVSGQFDFREVAKHFPLSWSHYVKLLAVKTDEARAFYESEALRGGWSVRGLERQINSLFYERALLSKNKAEMLKKGEKAKTGDLLTPDEEIRDPLVLEFLNLKDESFAKYALEGLPNKIVAREYLMLLPDEKTLQAEIEKIKHQLNK